MNYVQIRDCDVANGPGIRVSLFVAGCHNRCKGCFNTCARDFAAGKPFTRDSKEEIFRLCNRPYVRGLSILGGDPFAPENTKVLASFLRRFREVFADGKDVWCWTGYHLETELLKEGGRGRCECTDEMLGYIDYLVDGPFIEEKKDLTLAFRGSSNQRILRIKEGAMADESKKFD